MIIDMETNGDETNLIVESEPFPWRGIFFWTITARNTNDLDRTVNGLMTAPGVARSKFSGMVRVAHGQYKGWYCRIGVTSDG